MLVCYIFELKATNSGAARYKNSVAMDWRIDETTKTADGPNPKGRPRTVTSTVLKPMYCPIQAHGGIPLASTIRSTARSIIHIEKHTLAKTRLCFEIRSETRPT